MLIEKIRKIDPFYNGETGKDIDLSKLFGNLIKDKIVYNKDSKSFWFFNSNYWEEDTDGTNIRNIAKEFSLSMCKYADEILKNSKGGKRADEYSRDINKLRNYAQRETLIKDTKSNISVDYSIFDKDGMLFNCKNGTFNLRTFEFQKHNPKDFITKIYNVVYNEKSNSNYWDKFISQIMLEDREKIEYVQKLLGYCLTSDTKEEQMYVFYGESTRNGKSTLVETISYLMGNIKGYSANSQPDLIGKKNIDNRAPSEDLARLRGARAVFMSEPSKDMVINCSMVKQLVGGDTVTARKLRQNSFEYIPQFKMIMNTNHLCRINDSTMFYGNKIIVISFLRHFTKEEQDKTLKQKLKTEDEISAIFNWLIDGYKKYASDGLVLPESIKGDTDEYTKQSDKIIEFIYNCLVYQEGVRMDGNELYNSYKDYCTIKGYAIESNQLFYKELKNNGIIIDTGKVSGKNCRKRINNYILIDNQKLS